MVLKSLTYELRGDAHMYWLMHGGQAKLKKPTYQGRVPAAVLLDVRDQFPTRKYQWAIRIYDVRNGDTPCRASRGIGVHGVRLFRTWRGPHHPENLYTLEQGIELWLAHANMMYSRGTKE